MHPLSPDQFAGYLTLRGLSDNTVRTYLSFYSRWFGHPTGDPCWTTDTMWVPAGVREWSRTLPQSRSSLEQARTVVARACEAQGVDPELAQAVPIPRAARKKRTQALTPDEAHRLHEAALDSGLRGLAVLVGLYTAARRSEIASLSWARVDWPGCQVTLDRAKNRDLHTVPLHPTLRRVMRRHELPGDQWVFPGRYGGHVAPSTIWSWVGAVADAAEVSRMTPHRLRHTCLTDIVDATGDLRAAQDIAGHADPKVTALYTRTSDARKVAAIRVLDHYGSAA